MKKPVYMRILLLLLLYAAVFAVIVIIQFPKQGGFTQKIGNLAVSGQYRLNEANDPIRDGSAYVLSGRVSLVFGGIEFFLGEGAEDDTLRFIDEDGRAEELLPETMSLSSDTVLFRFPGVADLSFTTFETSQSHELRIFCAFSTGFTRLELPFRPLRRTGITDSGTRQITITADGLTYTFGNAGGNVSMDTVRGLVFLDAENPVLRYNARIETEEHHDYFSLEDFIVQTGEDKQSYTEAFNGWLTRNYSLWGRSIGAQNDEDLVVAIATEAVSRRTYTAALSAIPSAFLNGSSRAHRSAVYLGRLEAASRTLASADLERTNLVSGQINSRSMDFLLGEHVIEYLAVRGSNALLDGAAETAGLFNENNINLELVPGILEAYNDWQLYRPDAVNPFENLIEGACAAVSGALRLADGETKVFVCTLNEGLEDTDPSKSLVDIEFNLRLGNALLVWAENTGNDTWAAVARSIVISSLLHGEETGIKNFLITENGEITEDVASEELSTARLYNIMNTGIYYPRAVTVSERANGNIWAWTAASSLSSSRANNIFDISVYFPVGDSHYLLIRGISPFEKIQLYGIDYRTDPQFERYDSSGWAYLASTQTLLVKLKHREPVEHIRIFY